MAAADIRDAGREIPQAGSHTQGLEQEGQQTNGKQQAVFIFDDSDADSIPLISKNFALFAKNRSLWEKSREK